MFEYKVKRVIGGIRNRELAVNSLAQEGWRLICVFDHFHYFERYTVENNTPLLEEVKASMDILNSASSSKELVDE